MQKDLTTTKTKCAEENIDWDEVYTRLLPKIFHYFCYKVGDTAMAEELTAVTFEKAWMSRRNFHKSIGQIHAWMFGIARNVAVDYFRKNKIEISVEEMLELDSGNSVEDDVQSNLDFQTIVAILNRFSVRERDVIAMKYGAELSNREIAQLTKLSESNVGTILNRTVKKIRVEWEKSHA
jgi:RNA polymerase sigma-70 factor (ECF subfamily)